MTDLLARLATLPELRAAAEEQAKALVDERQRLFPSSLTWAALPFPMKREHIETALARLLDPNNPAAEGVLADLYRRATGWESAHADPVTDDDRTFAWQIVHLAPAVGMAQMPAWVDIDGTQAPTRYEAWGFALAAHYDLAAQTKTS